MRPTHQWQWLEDGGTWIPYDYDQNHELEAAFSASKDKVRIIGDRGGQYTRSKYGYEYEVVLTRASDGLYRQVRTPSRLLVVALLVLAHVGGLTAVLCL